MVAINKFKKYFPLQNINDVLKLLEDILNSKNETESDNNIIFTSILLGLIEYKLTQTNENEEIKTEIMFQNNDDYASVHIFSILFNDVIVLYKNFQSFVSEFSGDKLFKNDKRFINRAHLKLITDIVFSKLSVAKYKENCHNQSIFSFLTDKSLDSFGLAYTILSVAHLIGYRHVYLALSEDHAWLEYDGDETSNVDSRRFTADIAWTGKNEDKRCSSIDLGISERSRLYLGGNSVVCVNTSMAIVAAITTINPAKGSSSSSSNAYSNRSQNVTSNHSLELAILKRDLLWIAYNKDLLAKYPLAIINLADLERNYPKFQQLSSDNVDYPLILYREAVAINVEHYDNCHVYPYLSMANYFYHFCNFTRAMKCWRMAASVISKYNYKSEDWIIYREFFDIATHFIPDIFRSSVKDDNPLSKSSDSLYQASVAGSSMEQKKYIEWKDVFDISPEQREAICDELKSSTDFLTEFLCFYDYICLWEEGSSVPVLHEVWANKFKEVLIRFHENTRVSLKTIRIDADILNNNRSIDQMLSLAKLPSHIDNITTTTSIKQAKEPITKYPKRATTLKLKGLKIKKSSFSNEELMQVKDFWKAVSNDDISGLSSILASNVLNIDFLVNSSSPVKMYDFSARSECLEDNPLVVDLEDNSRQQKLEQDLIDYFATIKSIKRILSTDDDREHKSVIPKTNGKSEHPTPVTPPDDVDIVLLIDVFKSQKMKEICPLLIATGRLNIPAIKLPLTAQSQVSLKRTGLKSVYGCHSHEYPSTLMSRKRFKRN